jgi:hypothetical protein
LSFLAVLVTSSIKEVAPVGHGCSASTGCAKSKKHPTYGAELPPMKKPRENDWFSKCYQWRSRMLPMVKVLLPMARVVPPMDFFGKIGLGVVHSGELTVESEIG